MKAILSPLVLCAQQLLALSTLATASTVSGILDWSAYERWLDEAPRLIVLSHLDQPTRELLIEKTTLAEAILSTPAQAPVSAVNGPDLAAQATRDIVALRARFPAPVNNRYYTDRVAQSQVVRNLVATHSTDHNNVIEPYRRRIDSITPTNIASVIPQIENQIARDLRDIGQNYLQENNPGRNAKANRDWLLRLQSHVAEYNAIVARLTADASAQATSAQEGPTPQQQWQAFEARNMPILHRIVEIQTVETRVLDNGAYTHPANAPILIHFKIRGRDLYYLKEGKHRFRVFGETRQ